MEIWTVGHSTRTIEVFLEVPRSARIEAIADVRKLPGSRRMPWFDRDDLEASLRAATRSCTCSRPARSRSTPSRRPRASSPAA